MSGGRLRGWVADGSGCDDRTGSARASAGARADAIGAPQGAR